eukprot:15479136-Alexandrium_andersonii.AAC.2
MAIGRLPLIKWAARPTRVLVGLDPGSSDRLPASAVQGLSSQHPQIRVREHVDLALLPASVQLPEPPDHGHRVR